MATRKFWGDLACFYVNALRVHKILLDMFKSFLNVGRKAIQCEILIVSILPNLLP